MTDREQIFHNIREALKETQPTPRPEIDLDAFISTRRLENPDLWEDFKTNFEGVRGKCIHDVDALGAFLKEQGCDLGFCDPAFRETIGEPLSRQLPVEYTYSREQADFMMFTITRGSAVVAETGSILLKDRETVNRMAAVTPWVHVAVVDTRHIYRTVLDAIEDLDDDPNVIWVTGPSKTADIEGILIEGVHGPGEQVCFRI